MRRMSGMLKSLSGLLKGIYFRFTIYDLRFKIFERCFSCIFKSSVLGGASGDASFLLKYYYLCDVNK